MLHALIMAGGGGTRFWPKSRQKRPKQFLALTGQRTLLQETCARIEALAPAERTWIITGQMHRQETIRQVPQVPPERIIGEPCGRDTAACIGLGAALIAREDPDAIMLVMAADHVIEPVEEFHRAVRVAEQLVESRPTALVTMGIPPTFPATGYGYIHRGAQIACPSGVSVCRVQEFREKPSSQVAEQFLASGEYFWNSGIFVWRTRAILSALGEQQPHLLAAIQRIVNAWSGPDQDRVLADEYPGLDRISIDYAVMERARDVLVIQAPFRWDDVGSWLALERHHPQDAEGNTILAAHCGIDTKNCIVAAHESVLVATVGVENLIIVHEGDAILIADRRNEAGIKQLVDLLRAKGLEKHL
jgi:mannose-1-phosphate guanylyltransferase